MLSTKVSIWDLDGVLANNTHRLHWIKRDVPAWDLFHQHAYQDAVYHESLIVYKALQVAGIQPIIVTSRNFSEYSMTINWMYEKGIFNNGSYARTPVMMRPNDCRVSSVAFKRDCLRFIRTTGNEVLMAFEDHPGCVAMYRAAAVHCFAHDPVNWDGPEILR